MSRADQLKAARKTVNQFEFGTAEWEGAMQTVRELVRQDMEDESSPFVINYAVTIE